jgi:hypothetical protein
LNITSALTPSKPFGLTHILRKFVIAARYI